MLPDDAIRVRAVGGAEGGSGGIGRSMPSCLSANVGKCVVESNGLSANWMAGLVHNVALTRRWFTSRSAKPHLGVLHESRLLHVARPSPPWCPAAVGRRIQAGEKVAEGKGASEGESDRDRQTKTNRDRDRDRDRERETETETHLQAHRPEYQRADLVHVEWDHIWRRRGKEEKGNGERRWGVVVSLWRVMDTMVAPEMATSLGVT